MLTLDRQPLITHIEPVDPGDLAGDLIRPDNPLFGLIWINPARLSGAPCFYATRVPIKTMFDCFEAGQTLEDFLEDFEGVTREQAQAVLRLARAGLLADLPKP